MIIGFYKRNIVTWLLISISTLVYSGETLVVPSLPDWTRNTEQPNDVLALGKKNEWKLAPLKPKAGDEADETLNKRPKYKGARLRVVKDQPITIRVFSTKGYPVIMITDGPMYTASEHNYQLSDPDGPPMPGNPIAFAIAQEHDVSLTVNPSFSSNWVVWTWVLPVKLVPEESFELPAEWRTSMQELGYSEEQMSKLMSLPEIYRAWQALDLGK